MAQTKAAATIAMSASRQPRMREPPNVSYAEYEQVAGLSP